MIKVMIVDDSAVARSTLREIFAHTEDIQVIGSAPDPMIAFPIMAQAWPDVVISDIAMPRMDGTRFIRRIMVERPTPIIALSAANSIGEHIAVEALKEGVFALFPKPPMDVANYLRAHASSIAALVRAAKSSSPRNLFPQPSAKTAVADAALGDRRVEGPTKIVAIGISNGGVQALQYLLSALPQDSHGLVIAHHLPADFMHKVVAQFNKTSRLEVKLAEDGDKVSKGKALIAPGNAQCRVLRDGEGFQVSLKGSSDEHWCETPIDVLFESVAEAAGADASGIVMTGYGNDGAAGIQALARCGAETIAQDEASSVVFTMPREAIKSGAIKHIVSLYDLPEVIHQSHWHDQ